MTDAELAALRSAFAELRSRLHGLELALDYAEAFVPSPPVTYRLYVTSVSTQLHTKG